MPHYRPVQHGYIPVRPGHQRKRKNGYAEWAPGVVRALNLVHQRYPLAHISGTSLVVYMDDEVRLFPENVSRVTDGTAVTGSSASMRSELLGRIAERPDDIEALIDLARLELTQGHATDALAFVQYALILDPRHPRATTLKAEIERSTVYVFSR